MAPAILLVQLAGLAFSVALARVLGSSTGTDAYFLALSVPATVYLVMLAALRQGATPAITERLARSDEEFARAGSQLLSSVVLISSSVAVAATSVTLLAVPLVLGHDAQHLGALVRADLVALAPLPVLGGVTGTLAAIQTVRGRVAPAVAVTAFEPIAKTAFVLALGPAIGATSLVVGHLVGAALAAATLWTMIRRDGVPLRFVPTAFPPIVRDVLRVSTPLIVSQFVLQANPIVDRTMAAPLGPGSVTQLELGIRIFASATALLTGSLIGPVTAAWSARRVYDSWEAVRAGVVRAVTTVLLILPPILALGVALRYPMVKLIYGGGAYSVHALHVTADVVGMLVVGLPAYVLVVLFAALFVVQQSTVFPMLIGMANVILNVALNLLLRPVWGVAGIALSTSLTMTILLIPYARSATVRWDLRLREAAGAAARAAAAGAALALAALSLSAVPWSASRWGILAEVTVTTAALLTLHGAILLVTREPLALDALRATRQRLRHIPTTR